MRLALESVRQLKFRRNLLLIGSLGLVSILIWMSYSLYDIYRKDIVDPEVDQYLKPLNPSLDLGTLESLQDRYEPPSDFSIIGIDRQPGVANSTTTFTITRNNQNPQASPSANVQSNAENINEQ